MNLNRGRGIMLMALSILMILMTVMVMSLGGFSHDPLLAMRLDAVPKIRQPQGEQEKRAELVP